MLRIGIDIAYDYLNILLRLLADAPEAVPDAPLLKVHGGDDDGEGGVWGTALVD